MPDWIPGHSPSNDDLFGPVQGGMSDQDLYTYGGRAPQAQYDANGNIIGFGGSSADAAMGRYQDLANQARNGIAPQADTTVSNQYLGYGNDLMNQGQAARMSQGGAMQMFADTARGGGPDLAGAQLRAGMGQALANQGAAVAGARGAGAMGVAQASSANALAGAQANAIGQAGVTAAQTQLNAMQGYGNMANAMRGSDYAGAGLQFGNAGMLSQQALAQAQLREQQNQLNAQTGLGYEALGQNVGMGQLQAYENLKGMQEGHWGTQAGLDQRSQDRADKWTGALMNGAMGMMGG